MKLNYIKSADFEDLKANIKGNLEQYAKAVAWLPEYFGHDKWLLEAQHHFPEGIDLIMPGSGDNHNDFENTKKIYTALKDLPFSIAIDERFWTYLTHVTFWKYMRERWPLEKGIKTKKDPSLTSENITSSCQTKIARSSVTELPGYGGMAMFLMMRPGKILLS